MMTVKIHLQAKQAKRMKCSFTLILMMFITTSTFGQFSKGTIQAGGTLTAYQYQTNDEYSIISNSTIMDIEYDHLRREISILPRIGLFVNDKTSLGLGLGYSNQFIKMQFTEASVDREVRTNLFSAELFTRFHISASENFYFFIEPSLSVSFGKEKEDLDREIIESIFGISVGANPGLLYMINNKFGVEGSFGFLGYEQTTYKVTEPELTPVPKNVNKNFGLDFSLRTFELGLQFYF